MPLLKLENVDLAFGEHIIFDQIHLQLEKGERIGLIGRNGEGKSTLLKTILGEQDVDGGNVYRHPNIRIAQVSQALPPSSDVSVKDFVASGEQAITGLLDEYESVAQNPSPESLGRMEQLQHDIDLVDGWSLHHRLARTLETFELDKGQMLAELSGGWRRKAAIARALVSDPDILLLDEPTNHLDIGLISWLEDFIRNFRGAVIIITHDRAFLRSVSNRIAELDRGALTVWQGGYPDFLVFKQQQLDTEEKHNALFDKRLAQEEAWIREGIKARRTRNEGRVRALKKMRDERLQRRTQKQLGKIDIAKDSRSGKLVAELDGVTFGFDHETVIQDFSCTILRGDKIGLIGPNGVGKSTFLKLVLNDLTPVAGTIRTGTQINVAYFDQTLEQIDLDANVIDNVAEGRQSVDINGKEKHVLSYLQDFMFSPKRARAPVKALSGGERSRVLLAKLFSKPSNLLVMDEPTNDLDTDTLELLESLLVQYQGTVLLVSHDREFLDNVITSSIVFEGRGVLAEYVGGYQDWLNQGGSWEKIVSASADVGDNEGDNPAEGQIEKRTKPKKISYKLQRELDDLPANIEKQESRVEELSAVTLKPDFYQGDSASIKDALQLLTDAQEKLDLMYARWEELAEMTEKD